MQQTHIGNVVGILLCFGLLSGTSAQTSDSVMESWRQHFPDVSTFDKGTKIAIDHRGDVYVLGDFRGGYALVKYSGITGGRVWTVHQTDDYFPRDIFVDRLGNVYILIGVGPTSESDYITIKYNSAGEKQWTAIYNNDGDVPQAGTVDKAGNVYITGESLKTGQQWDYVTIKYKPDGEEEWVARYDAAKLNDTPRAIDVVLTNLT